MSFREWVSRPWGMVVALLAAIGVITGAIGSVQANPQRFLFAAALLGVAALIAGFLYIAFARTRPDLLGGSDYAFKRPARIAGMCGAVLAFGAVAFSLAHPQIRPWMLRGVTATPTVATDPPPPPRPDPRVDGRKLVIAEFNATGAPIQIRQRVFDAVDRKLRESAIEGIRVANDPTLVRSDEEARTLLGKTRAEAVIWGFADAEVAGVNVAFRERANALGRLEAEHVPWQVQDPGGMVGVRAKHAIDVASFIALYVAGQLLYLDNRHREGLAAFEQATKLVPAQSLTNAALFHYFRARALQNVQRPVTLGALPNEQELTEIACGYAQAIEADRRLYQAYNNLAILMKRWWVDTHGRGDGEFPAAATRCLADAGITVLSSKSLFAKAAAIRPDLTAIQFNILIDDWAGTDFYEDPELSQKLEALQKKDPSLVGPSVVLGVMAADRNDLVKAEALFRKALEIDPRSPGVKTNVAQILRRRGDAAGAETLLREAVRENAADTIAALSLASILLGRGDAAGAAALIAPILADPRTGTVARWWETQVRSYFDAAALAGMFRILLDARGGKPDAAVSRLGRMIEAQYTDEGLGPYNDLLHFVRALVQERAGRNPDRDWRHAYEDLEEDRRERFRRSSDMPLPLAWSEIVYRCQPGGKNLKPRRWRDAGGCLAGTPDDALNAVYTAIYDASKYLLHHRQMMLAGLG